MASKSLLVIGAGGHAHALLSVIKRHGEFKTVGLIDNKQPIGSKAHGEKILGNEADLPKVCKEFGVVHLLVAIGDNHLRQTMTSRLQNLFNSAIFPALIDPSAVVASDARIAPGVVVMPQAHIGAGCDLNMGVLVNTNASLDHDSSMGSFSSLAPGVITGGSVEIKSKSAICLGTKINNGISIGSNSVIGAGSLVLKNIPSGVVAYGCPAQVIRTRKASESYL